MGNTQRILLFFLFPIGLNAQVYLTNNGARMNIMSSTDVQVQNGALHNKNFGKISNNGNIYIDYEYNEVTGANYVGGTSSWLWFEGGGSQNITGDAQVSIHRIKVDNGDRIVLGTDVSTAYRVDLNNNGSVELGNSDLIIEQGGDIVNYSRTHHIITNGTGYLQQEVSGAAVFYPIGNSSYNPAILANTGTLDNFQARVVDNVQHRYPTGNPVAEDVVNRAWMIDEEVVGGSNVTMTLEWDAGQELTKFDRNACGISRWDGSWWDRSSTYTPFSVGSASNMKQTRSGITAFSPFVIEDSEETLPLQFLTFKATRKSSALVELKWNTGEEVNNRGFKIERMLENEENFKPVGFVEAKQGGNGSYTYKFDDPNAYVGYSYYRIKQEDFDDKFTYSWVEAVKGTSSSGRLTGLIYPNPAFDLIYLKLTKIPKNTERLEVSIFNVYGQRCIEKEINIQGSLSYEIVNVKDLPSGAYMVEVVSNTGHRLYNKLIKE